MFNPAGDSFHLVPPLRYGPSLSEFSDIFFAQCLNIMRAYLYMLLFILCFILILMLSRNEENCLVELCIRIFSSVLFSTSSFCVIFLLLWVDGWFVDLYCKTHGIIRPLKDLVLQDCFYQQIQTTRTFIHSKKHNFVRILICEIYEISAYRTKFFIGLVVIG